MPGVTVQALQRRRAAESGRPPVEVIGLDRIVGGLVEQAESRSYIDDPVLVTVKALNAANRLGAESESD
jgi:hypothetical protein